MRLITRNLLPRTRRIFSPLPTIPLRTISMNASTPSNSTPTSKPSANPPSNSSSASDSTPASQPLALPETPSNPTTTSTTTTQLDLSTGSTTLKLDHLGPLVIGKDGSLGRIANWEGMTEGERENTVRVLGKRNRVRLEGLRGTEEGEGKGEWKGEAKEGKGGEGG